MNDTEPTSTGLSGYTCSGCDTTWSGVSRCHCSATKPRRIEFVADPSKDKSLTRKVGGLTPIDLSTQAQLIADLTEDRWAQGFKRSTSVRRAQNATSNHVALDGNWTQVLWLFPAGEQPTFQVGVIDGKDAIVALDIDDELFWLPSLIRRPRTPIEPGTKTVTLQVDPGCHRTFSGLSGFDLHHTGGSDCLDPATIFTAAGERKLFLTDGLWQGVETPAPRTFSKRKTTDENVW